VTVRKGQSSIRFAGSVLGAQRHICAFFHSPDEEYELRNWADAYLRDSHFDQDQMLALIRDVFESGPRHQPTRARPSVEYVPAPYRARQN
jgi:hypothetical protein